MAARRGAPAESDRFGKEQIHAFVLGAVAPQTMLVTDDWPSYHDIPEIKHKAITLGPMAAHIVLPWTHRLFSKLKRRGLGFATDCVGWTSSTPWTSSCSASFDAVHGKLRSIAPHRRRTAQFLTMC